MREYGVTIMVRRRAHATDLEDAHQRAMSAVADLRRTLMLRGWDAEVELTQITIELALGEDAQSDWE